MMGRILHDDSSRTHRRAPHVHQQRLLVDDEGLHEFDALTGHHHATVEHRGSLGGDECLVAGLLHQLPDTHIVDVSLGIHVGPSQRNLDSHRPS